MEWVELILGLSAESRLIHQIQQEGKTPTPTMVEGMNRQQNTSAKCRNHKTHDGFVRALREHRGTVVEVDK